MCSTDADGVPLAPAPRTKTCETAGSDYEHQARARGLLVPLLRRRRAADPRLLRAAPTCAINGDAALSGYCYPGHHVFCVTYFETSMPC